MVSVKAACPCPCRCRCRCRAVLTDGDGRRAQPLAYVARLVGESLRRHSFVAMADVAAYVAAAVHHEAATNRTLVPGGPEAVTRWDAVRTVERARGRDIAVRTVTPGDDVPGPPPAMSAITTSMETYDSRVDMEEAARTFGVMPTSLGTFADRFVARASGQATPANRSVSRPSSRPPSGAGTPRARR